MVNTEERPDWVIDEMNRTQFLRRAGGAAVALGGLSALRAAVATGAPLGAHEAVKGGTLNLYTWPNYFAPRNLQDFKKATGIKINTTFLESNNSLFAKLNSSAGANYDVVLPSQYWVGIEAQRHLLLKLDKSRIPYAYVDKKLLAK